jgi:hypothetical protein
VSLRAPAWTLGYHTPGFLSALWKPTHCGRLARVLQARPKIPEG